MNRDTSVNNDAFIPWRIIDYLPHYMNHMPATKTEITIATIIPQIPTKIVNLYHVTGYMDTQLIIIRFGAKIRTRKTCSENKTFQNIMQLHIRDIYDTNNLHCDRDILLLMGIYKWEMITS